MASQTTQEQGQIDNPYENSRIPILRPCVSRQTGRNSDATKSTLVVKFTLSLACMQTITQLLLSSIPLPTHLTPAVRLVSCTKVWQVVGRLTQRYSAWRCMMRSSTYSLRMFRPSKWSQAQWRWWPTSCQSCFHRGLGVTCTVANEQPTGYLRPRADFSRTRPRKHEQA